jgi:hypothetical protein
LNTGKETSVYGNSMYGSLAVNSYENKVVWTGGDMDGDVVNLYDISTDNETTISARGYPDIYGNYVVILMIYLIKISRVMGFTCIISILTKRPRLPMFTAILQFIT